MGPVGYDRDQSVRPNRSGKSLGGVGEVTLTGSKHG